MSVSDAEKEFLEKIGQTDEGSPEVEADKKDVKPENDVVDTANIDSKPDVASDNNIVKQEPTKDNGEKKFVDKLPLKKWWFWVIIVVLVCIIISVFASIGSGRKKVEQVYSELERPDLNGLKISEACEKVRAIGWRIDEVAGDNDYSEKSDCSDTERTVTRYYYNYEKYYEFDGSVRSNYETVSLRFNNAKKEEEKSTQTDNSSSDSATPQSEDSAPSTPVDSGSSSSESTPSSSTPSASPEPSSTPRPSSSSTYQSIYDTYSARLRNECPTKSITECAEIANEGVEKMAEYMWKASGTDGQYETYSSWSSKLYDVYMESVR